MQTSGNKIYLIAKNYRNKFLKYMMSVILVIISIKSFYRVLDYYEKPGQSWAEIFTDLIILLPLSIIYLLGFIFIYNYTLNKFKNSGEDEFQSVFLDSLSKKIRILFLVFQFADTGFVMRMVLTEISQDPKYIDAVALYWFVGLSIFYGFFVIPNFLAYILLSVFDQKIKRAIFSNYGSLYPPGRTRINLQIIISFVVMGIFPYIIFLLNIATTSSGSLLEGDRVFVLGTILLVFIGAILSFFFFNELISDPIERLVEAMNRVEEGDLTERVPISKSNELSILSAKFNEMLDGLEEKERIKDEFGKYLSPEVAKEILSSGKNIWEGEEKEVTILFTDIEGYTSISEQMSAQEVVVLLNEYFTDIVSIIAKHNGVVNKFIGDAVLAIFNAPLDDENHAIRAVESALEILKLTKDKKYRGNIKIKTRIGINTGKVVLGNLGSKIRQEYTVIGDAVNIAQRLESYNKQSGTELLVSESTFNKLGGKFSLSHAGEIKVKGRESRVVIYR